jgi:hypothetical protein
VIEIAWPGYGDGFGQLEGVDAEPLPADGSLAGTGQESLNLAQRAVGQRAALVGAATGVAVVLAFGAVLDVGAASAVRAAGAELLVERVQHLTVDAAHRRSPSSGRMCVRMSDS